MTLPTPAEVESLVAPGPDLAREVRAFLGRQLGGVLPRDPVRGLDWYFDWVVRGRRALEAWTVLQNRLPPDLPLIDLGSGTGSFVLLARGLGATAFGIEPGEEVQLAERRWRERHPQEAPPFVRGAGELLPFADSSVGAVLAHDVLEHVADWRCVLRECRRVLAPGGILYVKGPNYAARFVEPHYRVPWLPMLPKPVAARYLSWLGRDVTYLAHLGYRRRGAVLAQLRDLGFDLSFPRREKLQDTATINRPWVRTLASSVAPGRPLARVGAAIVEQPLQSVIDVVGQVPR